VDRNGHRDGVWSRLRRLVCLRALLAWPAGAADPEQDILNVKSAFLLKLAETTTWPAASRTNASRLVIGFVNAPELLAVTRRLMAGDSGDRIVLVDVDSPEAAAACHAIYFGRLDAAARGTLEGLRARPVLTLGEGNEFVAGGGIFGFEFRRGKGTIDLNYYVNIQAMDHAQVRLRPEFLNHKNRLRSKEAP
jgi:hypothetical protein